MFVVGGVDYSARLRGHERLSLLPLDTIISSVSARLLDALHGHIALHGRLLAVRIRCV